MKPRYQTQQGVLFMVDWEPQTGTIIEITLWRRGHEIAYGILSGYSGKNHVYYRAEREVGLA